MVVAQARAVGLQISSYYRGLTERGSFRSSLSQLSIFITLASLVLRIPPGDIFHFTSPR